jgi:hypothetical protein
MSHSVTMDSGDQFASPLTLSHTHTAGSRSEPPMSLLLVLAFCQLMARHVSIKILIVSNFAYKSICTALFAKKLVCEWVK